MPKGIMDDWDEANNIHTLYYSLCRYLCRWYYKLTARVKIDEKSGELVQTKRKYREVDWSQLVGYRAICRMQAFAEKNPGIIEIDVDDEYFAGSSMFVIPHMTTKKYMGETVIYVSQCSPERNVFFLYPCYVKSLEDAISKIKKRKGYDKED